MEKPPQIQIKLEKSTKKDRNRVANIQNPLVVKLFGELEKRKMGVPDFERETGIKKDRVYKWKQEGTDPKSGDVEKIKAWLGEMEKSPMETNEPLTLKALVNLTESNKTLAEANRTLATSHAKLTVMVESGFTADVLKETGLGDSSTILDLLEVLADVGVHAKKWHSKQEALAELHRIGVEFGKRGRVKGIRDGVGSSHKR